MAFPLINPILQFFDNSGNVLSGGLLYTYAPGTTTPKTTYSDENLSVPNANPVVLDSAGRCTIFLTDGEEYKFVLQTSAGVTLRTVDEVKSPSALTSANIGAALFPRTDAEIAAGVTPTNYAIPSHDAVVEYLAARYGVDVDNSAAANSTALTNAVAVCPALGTLRLPEGVLQFNPFVLTKAVKLLGAGVGKHGTSGHGGRTVWQCTDVDEFALVCERSQSSGYDPFHIEGIRFYGNQVGYGGVHFGSDVADGGTYSNLTGKIVDCHFNQFTTYGLALRRAFDVVIERVNATEIRDSSTLSTTGRAIALLANNPSSASVTLDMTVITIRDCDTSSNHIGVYVEECEVLRIENHQASGNNREGIKFFSKEYINNVVIDGGYLEVNNASRNDAGLGGSYPLDYYDIDMQRDTTSTKASTYISGVRILNPHQTVLVTSGKMHLNHVQNSSIWLRNNSADGDNIAFGNDISTIDITVTSPIKPYNETAGALSTSFVGSSSFTGTLTGMTASTTGTVRYTLRNNKVELLLNATIEGTSNTTAMTMTGLPAIIQPVNSQVCAAVSEIENNGAAASGVAAFGAGSGTITFSLYQQSGGFTTRSATAFTNAGTKGLFTGCRIVYDLD